MNKKRMTPVHSLLLSVATLMVPGIGYTADFGLQPRLSTGVMHYSFKGSGSDLAVGSGRATTNIDYDDQLVFIGGGLTAFYRRFFADIYFQQSAEGEVFLSETPTTFGFGLHPQRQDFSVSAGYSVLPNLALFAGYKYGKTENEGTIFDGVDLGGTDIFPNGRAIRQEFEEQGPFIGGVFGWNFGNIGRISANIAVAFLDADERAGQQVQGGELTRTTTGDAIGVSYGVGWNASITDRLSYAINLNGYNYSFDNFSGTTFNDSSNSDRDINFDENMIGINLSASYSLL